MARKKKQLIVAAAATPRLAKDPSEIMYQIAGKLLDIMKTHIGRDNAISIVDLFKKVYNKDFDSGDYNHWTWLAFLKGGMRMCRLYSKCFIVPVKGEGHKCDYCVVKDQDDTKEYVKFLREDIVRIKKSIVTSQVAVDDKWYNKVWKLEPKEFNEPLKIK